MSDVTRETSTSTATLWKKLPEDEFGRGGFAAPVVISVCFDVKVALRYSGYRIDKAPNSVLYKEIEGEAFDPAKGDYIARGDHSGVVNPNDAGAEVVTSVEVQDCSLLGEVDDLMVMT